MKQNYIHYMESLCAGEADFKLTTKPHKMPIVASSTFEFESIEQGIEIFKKQPGDHVYTRYGNPSIEAVAQKIADLENFGSPENCYGLLTSSGMSAIYCVISGLLSSGDTVITQGNLYGGTSEQFIKIFSKFKINTEVIAFEKAGELHAALQKPGGNKLVYLETPANPTLQCLDISAIAQVVQQYNSILVVDNTFATPCLQQPLLLGADIVLHSTTKYLHGHGASTGGAIVCKSQNYFERCWETMKLTGCNSNAFDAWLINLGLKTLPLRIQKQCENAMSLALRLTNLEGIKTIHYPGLPGDPNYRIAKQQMKAFGAILSFETGKDASDAIQFANRLKLCKIAPSLGEPDSMILHPATMSHMKMPADKRLQYGITDSLIRLSVGIEHVDDIYEDILRALKKSS